MCTCVLVVEWFMIFGCIPTNGIAGSNGISSSRSSRNCHPVFHNGWTNLHSHQWCESGHFSNDQWWWAFFHMFVGHINVFFWEVSVRILCPLFDGVVGALWDCIVSDALPCSSCDWAHRETGAEVNNPRLCFAARSAAVRNSVSVTTKLISTPFGVWL